MEEEGVEVVLAKATELRFKISNCIRKANSASFDPQKPGAEKDVTSSFSRHQNPSSHGATCQKGDKQEHEDEEEHEDDEETERLLNVHDAIESLEVHLIILQNLQQQQRYERELALKEIDYCRQMLLEKLKEYKGKDLEVLHEASLFAGETVRNDSDLLLPPYPCRPPRSLALDSGYLSHVQQPSKAAPDGITSGRTNGQAKENAKDCGPRGKGLGGFIISAAQMVLPVVGAIYLLSLSSGLAAKPKDGNKSIPDRLWRLFQQQPTAKEKHTSVVCPPGKVLVIEGGEARCLVKERVEIPFDSDVAKPDVNYGCG